MALNSDFTQFYKPWFASTPVNAKKATGTLTLTDVVKDTDYFTVNGIVYEFASDVAQTVTSGRVPVSIVSTTVAAQGTLTVDTQPTATNTMTIGTTVYTFRAPSDADVAGEISIGTDLATAQAAIVAAINGTDGINTAHPLVSAGAFADNACIITALRGGTAGNSVATTETFTAGTNVFDAVVLGTTRAGTDCSAANGEIAIVDIVTATDTEVTAVGGSGTTVVFSSALVGTEGNAIDTTENMTNATFAEATLLGGQYATPAKCAGFIIISGVWYVAKKGGDKYSTDTWYSSTPTIIS